VLHAVVHWEVLWCANKPLVIIVSVINCFSACVQALVDRLIRAACSGALEGALVCY